MKEILQPTYWGSLLSLIVICTVAVIDYIREQVSKAGVIETGSWIYVVFAAMLCVLIAIRYYIAVSVSIYSGQNKTVMDLPYPLNLITFFLLSLLILSCNVMIAALGLFGPTKVLLWTDYIIYVSLGILLIIFIASCFRPNKISRAPWLFMLVDIILLCVIFILDLVHNNQSESSEKTEIILGMTMAITAFMILHETRKVFLEPISNQVSELCSVLLKTKS